MEMDGMDGKMREIRRVRGGEGKGLGEDLEYVGRNGFTNIKGGKLLKSGKKQLIPPQITAPSRPSGNFPRECLRYQQRKPATKFSKVRYKILKSCSKNSQKLDNLKTI